jgi:hypothetical protein
VRFLISPGHSHSSFCCFLGEAYVLDLVAVIARINYLSACRFRVTNLDNGETKVFHFAGRESRLVSWWLSVIFLFNSLSVE